jgi:putative ABC transport system substrate-binding protein
MIKRIGLLITVLLLLPLVNASSSEASEIVVLKSADIRPYNEALEGFRSSCDCRISEEISHRQGETADVSAEVLREKPDGVFAIGIDALSHIRGVRDIPVVYSMIPNFPPTSSLGKNVSGVNMNIPPEKYLSAMVELFPSARRIGLVYGPGNMEPFVQEAARVAESKGISLVMKKAFKPGDAPSLIEGMKDKIDVFWMLPDMTVVSQEAVNFLLLFSFQNRVPVFTFSSKYVEMGAVAGLNMTPFDMGVQAGEMMKRLINEKGARSPIRTDARKVVLLINHKVAKKMGIKIREEASRRAEEVN